MLQCRYYWVLTFLLVFIFPEGCCEVHEGIVDVYDETGKIKIFMFKYIKFLLNAVECGISKYLILQ